ncbi:SusD/RagB family nutrient-binding outer membrane lipoprotein, partial [Lishizhenia sp.]|uniref:SusD/RagB family nutrient-binding outer membrane lipoprotein n=1 Tax=Lishizhenia sp. TaxID=2497594 RepID=UPI00299D1C4C
LIVSVFLAFSCKKFDEYNVNPNAPEDVHPQFLLSNVIAESADNQAYWGWHAGALLAQHSANLEFLPVDRYDLGNNEGLWNETYRLLNDLKSVREAEESNEAYRAVADILQAHQASLLTDLWTNVPYFEALEGEREGNFTPAFDRQEDIYLKEGGILDLLRTAVDILETTNHSIEGDILYNGDLNKWIKFANALRVRYLLRISNQYDGSVELQEIVTEGNFFQGNEDNAVLPYLTSSPNQWVIFTEREGRYVDVRMSKNAENIMGGLSDDRVGRFYKPTNLSQQNGTSEFKGIPNGLSRANQNNYDLNDISLMGSFLRDIPDGMKAVYMNYAELQFCLAEAAQKGWISGSPQAYYEEGIQASFDYFEVALPNNYLLSADVVLNGVDNLERIMTQKWINSFMNGYEAWFDIRRTGYPSLTIPADNLNGDVYPVRYAYPSTEQAVNGSNYSDAVSEIGGDNYNSKGWWEQ